MQFVKDLYRFQKHNDNDCSAPKVRILSRVLEITSFGLFLEISSIPYLISESDVLICMLICAQGHQAAYGSVGVELVLECGSP